MANTFFLSSFDSLTESYVDLRRTLNNTEKADYITAVKCLQSQPAQKPMIQAARTRFDELQALHIYFAEGIHVVVRQTLLCLESLCFSQNIFL
jgi:hypothetical protein